MIPSQNRHSQKRVELAAFAYPYVAMSAYLECIRCVCCDVTYPIHYLSSVIMNIRR